MRYCFIIMGMLLCGSLFAQSKEQAQLFKKFAGISNESKRAPLQLTVEYKNTSNVPTSGDDTLSLDGAFYIQPQGAYIRLGDIEQVVSDSFVLIVMNDIHQMVLTKNTTGLAPLMAQMMRLPVTDTSITKVAERYVITEKKATGNISVLQMQNITTLPVIALPADEAELTFDNSTNVPMQVKTTKRILFIMPEQGYENYKGTVVDIPGEGKFILKEDIGTYVYKKLEHRENITLPVSLSDRIIKNADGNFVPVKKYQDYKIVLN